MLRMSKEKEKKKGKTDHKSRTNGTPLKITISPNPSSALISSRLRVDYRLIICITFLVNLKREVLFPVGEK